MKRTDLPTKDQQIRFYCSLWLECCTAWVETHPDEFDKDVLAEATATYEAKNKSPLRWPNIYRQLCRQHISGILQGFFSGLNELMDEFVAPVLPKLKKHHDDNKFAEHFSDNKCYPTTTTVISILDEEEEAKENDDDDDDDIMIISS
ncbi:hypothetical protein QOT17_023911 [Balamuthia mandrillaris]